MLILGRLNPYVSENTIHSNFYDWTKNYCLANLSWHLSNMIKCHDWSPQTTAAFVTTHAFVNERKFLNLPPPKKKPCQQTKCPGDFYSNISALMWTSATLNINTKLTEYSISSTVPNWFDPSGESWHCGLQHFHS